MTWYLARSVANQGHDVTLFARRMTSTKGIAMSVVSRTFTVAAAPDLVVPYLADFSHAEEWDPGTVRCRREDQGPVGVGSSWRNTSKIAGLSTELTYTLEQLTTNRIILVGRNATAISTETIDVTPAGTGSTVTYTNEVEFKGLAKLASPLAKVVFEKLGTDTQKRLVRTLDGLTV